MPSRFAFYSSIDEINEKYKVSTEIKELFKYYNLKPTNRATGIINDNGLKLVRLRWGLVEGSQLFKARSETIHEKSTFKEAFRNRRCLILANGFFEWTHGEGVKNVIPHYFTIKNEKIFTVAGIFNSKFDKEDNQINYRFAVITTDANELVATVFHRMAVIVSTKDIVKWLDPKTPEEKLRKMLKPYDSSLMDSWKVKSLPSRGDNGPATIKPLSESGLSKFF
ncbi:MAG: SOS response-associated peptidase [Candidatus Hodarchaeales archaeon]|jgi:putative SOS response-associated peptidase YedK